MTVPISPAPTMLNAAINMAQIGTIPKPYATPQNFCRNMKGAVVNGDAVFFIDIGSPTGGFYAVRIRPSDFAYAEYSYFVGGQPRTANINSGGYGCQQVSSNTLQVFNTISNSYMQFTLPNQAAYGTRTQLQNSFPNIPGPCGVGTLLNTFYAAQQNLVAYEFGDIFSEDYYDYVSIYSLGVNGEQLQNAGYIGEVANGQNAFNQTVNNLPPEIDTGTPYIAETNSLNFSNGWASYCSNGYTSNWNMGATEITIVQNQIPLQCDRSFPNANTYVTTSNEFNWTAAQLEVLPNYAVIIQGKPAGSYCEVPGIFVIGGSAFSFSPSFWGFTVFAQDLIVQVAINQGIPLESLVLMKDGTIIGLYENGSGWDVWQGYFDITAYQFQFPSLTFRAQSTLVNYARPISVNGSFLT